MARARHLPGHGPRAGRWRGTIIQRRLFNHYQGKTDLQLLAERYDILDGKINGEKSFSMLRPKGWIVAADELEGRRYSIHEHDQRGWFRRTSFFIWFFDIGSWRKDNEVGLARICFDAAHSGLERGGLSPGPVTEDLLLYKRQGKEYPLHHAVCLDRTTGLSGIFALSVRVEEKAGLVCVMGFSARLDSNNRAGAAKARQQLTEMIASLKFED